MDTTEERTNVLSLDELVRRSRKQPIKLWGGMGHGAICANCAKPISESHHEYEFESEAGTVLHMHVECFLSLRLKAADG